MFFTREVALNLQALDSGSSPALQKITFRKHDHTELYLRFTQRCLCRGIELRYVDQPIMKLLYRLIYDRFFFYFFYFFIIIFANLQST
jgi:hypothetical protein